MNKFLITKEGEEQVRKAKDGDAGIDLYAQSEPKIVGKRVEGVSNTDLYTSIDYIEYRTGIKIEPESWDNYVLIYPRSSISNKNLVLANSVGVIDTGYRGELIVRFKYIIQPEDLYLIGNTQCKVNQDKIYQKGDKICQIVLTNHISGEIVEVSKLTETTRGEGGFGSTGK